MKHGFVGIKPQVKLFQAVKNSDFVKPKGGLWTSPIKEDTTPWIEWIESEQFYKYPSIGTSLWELVPSKEIKYYVIDSWVDLKGLPHFSILEKPPEKDEPILLNFEKISHYWDAIHLSEKGLRDCYWSLYGWDIPSTLWLKWSFTEVIKVKDLEF